VVCHLSKVDSRVECQVVNKKSNCNNEDPKYIEADDDSSHELLCVSSSDGSNIQLSTNKEGLLSAVVMDNSNESSKDDSEKDERDDDNGSSRVNSFSHVLIDFRVMNIFSKFPRVDSKFISVKLELSSNRANLVRGTNLAVSILLPNGSSRTRDTLDSMASNQSLRA
jgi:hypothetical protein